MKEDKRHIIYDVKNKMVRILTTQVDSSTCQLRKIISQTFGPVGDSSAE